MRKRSSTSPLLAITLLPAAVTRRPMKKKKKQMEKKEENKNLKPFHVRPQRVMYPQMILKRLHNNSVRLKDWGFLMRVLSGDMASYVIPHFHSCIKNKDIKDSILTENPAPSNLIKVKKTWWVCASSSEGKWQLVCTLDTTFDKFHKKI